MTEKQELALAVAREKGVIRPRDLKGIGSPPTLIRNLVTSGWLTRSARGLYSLSEYEVTEHHTIVEAIRLQSNGVVCLLSALNFHVLGTQQPHKVWLAVPFGSRIAKSNTVPIRTVVLTSPAYESGIEIHRLEGIDVPVYSVAKTVADCFKFRHKIGLDVALEALREALRERRCNSEEIRKYAKINHVEKVMRPYVEAMAV